MGTGIDIDLANPMGAQTRPMLGQFDQGALMPQDLMVDLETLGNSAGCVILSIGAVTFDPATGELGKEFYTVINVNSQVCLGLMFDQDTLDWWKKQTPEARQVLKDAYAENAPRVNFALHSFGQYLNDACGGKSPRLWGNGADFDNSILASVYKAAGVRLPWKFWDSRCYRTLKNLYPEVALPKRTGTHHNALDDAKTQAEHALMIFAARRPKPEPFDWQRLAAAAKVKLDPATVDDLIG